MKHYNLGIIGVGMYGKILMRYFKQNRDTANQGQRFEQSSRSSHYLLNFSKEIAG